MVITFPIACPLKIPLWVYYRIVQGVMATCPITSSWKQEDPQEVGRLKAKRSGVQSHLQLPETLLKQKQTKQDTSKEYNVIPHQQSKRKKLTAMPQGGAHMQSLWGRDASRACWSHQTFSSQTLLSRDWRVVKPSGHQCHPKATQGLHPVTNWVQSR